MHEGHRQRRPKFARGSGDCFSPSPEEGEKPSKLRFPSMKVDDLRLSGKNVDLKSLRSCVFRR